MQCLLGFFSLRSSDCTVVAAKSSFNIADVVVVVVVDVSSIVGSLSELEIQS